MHIVISFKTSKFDVSKERENPIFGELLLKWLKSEVESDFSRWKSWNQILIFPSQMPKTGVGIAILTGKDVNICLEPQLTLRKVMTQSQN